MTSVGGSDDTVGGVPSGMPIFRYNAFEPGCSIEFALGQIFRQCVPSCIADKKGTLTHQRRVLAGLENCKFCRNIYFKGGSKKRDVVALRVKAQSPWAAGS